MTSPTPELQVISGTNKKVASIARKTDGGMPWVLDDRITGATVEFSTYPECVQEALARWPHAVLFDPGRQRDYHLMVFSGPDPEAPIGTNRFIPVGSALLLNGRLVEFLDVKFEDRIPEDATSFQTSLVGPTTDFDEIRQTKEPDRGRIGRLLGTVGSKSYAMGAWHLKAEGVDLKIMGAGPAGAASNIADIKSAALATPVGLKDSYLVRVFHDGQNNGNFVSSLDSIDGLEVTPTVNAALVFSKEEAQVFLQKLEHRLVGNMRAQTITAADAIQHYENRTPFIADMIAAAAKQDEKHPAAERPRG